MSRRWKRVSVVKWQKPAKTEAPNKAKNQHTKKKQQPNVKNTRNVYKNELAASERDRVDEWKGAFTGKEREWAIECVIALWASIFIRKIIQPPFNCVPVWYYISELLFYLVVVGSYCFLSHWFQHFLAPAVSVLKCVNFLHNLNIYGTRKQKSQPNQRHICKL